MSLATNWLDEMDDDDLDIDRSDDDTLSDETEPLAHLESGDDELEELYAEQEPDEVPDEGGFNVVLQYFQESARHQSVSVPQEQAQTQTVARGRHAAKKLMRSRPTLNSTAQRQLRRDLAQARTARDELVRSNARLVISIAKRYQNLGLQFMDLIQEGNLGLLRAIERFEPARGLRLSTYVRGECGRA